MNDNAKIMLSVFCPGCRLKHDLAVDREHLKRGVESGGDVELYCVRTDSHWQMTDEEKQNTRKAFAGGTL